MALGRVQSLRAGESRAVVVGSRVASSFACVGLGVFGLMRMREMVLVAGVACRGFFVNTAVFYRRGFTGILKN